ncbi:fasciclin domain-containing protein [Spirosoma agri]|uniref:Fasciclin domain-containing protein n=1 Tax=Spirosoma agri TaxID=1987381 RepID=A0A6M0IEE6_9BACT|nr:fasciclin domain-containing protein [Spirosoma agri]NEU66207.1 fasciclin domain-containing protein [Spirosoma agri]
MKINRTLSLLTLGAVLAAEATWAQTTPTGAATSTTYPQGAIVPDSTSGNSSRSQRRAMKRTKKAMEQNARTNANSGTSTSIQDGQYRKSSSSDGTAINNSNTTNYNSNNVTNAPTGVGSNPSTITTTTPADQVSNGQNNSAARSSGSSSGGSYSPNTGATPSGTSVSTSGTGAAVSGARSSEAPAVKAGSTNRSSSVGDFISSSPNYTTLQNALQSADLFETLKGTGPYTVFAPSNSAFKKLPTSAQNGLLEGSNREALKQLLSYHVVRGEVDMAELTRRVKAGNGKAELQTLAGSTLTAKQGSNGSIDLTDDQGHTASIDAADNYKSANGVVHSINVVLMPKAGGTLFR